MPQNNHKEEGEKWLREHRFTYGAGDIWISDDNSDIYTVFRHGKWVAVVASWVRGDPDVREALASATRAAKDSVMWTNVVVADAEKLTVSGT